MTAQAQERQGRGVVAVVVVVLLGLIVLALGQLGDALDALDAQPIPPQPTVAMPPPVMQYVSGLGTINLLSDTDLVIDGAQVRTGVHAEEKHGLEEAQRVREEGMAFIIANPIFGQQPPCKDGRYRFVFPMRAGGWGVWVMEKIGEALFDEKTAFIAATQNYAKGINEDCGNGPWLGHAYGW